MSLQSRDPYTSCCVQSASVVLCEHRTTCSWHQCTFVNTTAGDSQQSVLTPVLCGKYRTFCGTATLKWLVVPVSKTQESLCHGLSLAACACFDGSSPDTCLWLSQWRFVLSGSISITDMYYFYYAPPPDIYCHFKNNQNSNFILSVCWQLYVVVFFLNAQRLSICKKWQIWTFLGIEARLWSVKKKQKQLCRF